MCRKLTRQQWYNQRITCIGHFYAEQGVRYTKPEIVQGLAPAMTIDEFMSVVPHWADNNKRAAFMELVKNWVGENPDFKAVSDRNKANRGSRGTHICGEQQHRSLSGAFAEEARQCRAEEMGERWRAEREIHQRQRREALDQQLREEPTTAEAVA
nr:uncharacterized protein LOC127346744 [Lolium perenne]